MPKIEGVQRATGRTRQQWFALLDAWGAVGRPYREIADWLTGEHGLSRWWAQKLIVEYEQERGVRDPGVRRGGTFEIGASKTIAAPVERVFDALVNTRERKRWLTDATMTLRHSEPHCSAQFLWQDGSTRVKVTLIDKGPSKTTVALSHDRITSARTAQMEKDRWKKRLVELKAYLEA